MHCLRLKEVNLGNMLNGFLHRLGSDNDGVACESLAGGLIVGNHVCGVILVGV